MYRHFLVPVDDSDAGIDAVACAVELARSIGARITFVDRDREPCERARTEGSTLGTCMREMARAKAEAAARAQGVPCDSMHVAADARYTLSSNAGARGWDLVCIAPPSREAEARTASRGQVSAAFAMQFVATGVPVLTCTVQRSPAAARVVAALYGTHRATIDPLCALLAAARAAAPSGNATRAVRLAPHLHSQGLDDLRISRFGPGGACWLSSMLRGRTAAVDAELGELERQYRHGTTLHAELMRAAAGGGGAPQRVDAALDAYAQFVCEYFGRKEGVIVPAAQRYLRDDDWREIGAAIEAILAGKATGPRQLNVSRSAHR